MKQKTRASAFKEAFNNLAYKYDGHRVWRDFVTMAACSLSGLSGGDHFEERERMYLESASHYKAEELDGFSAMMACTILAINENPEQDFLGSLYGELRLINRSAEQFFTPYCIATLMARVALPPLEKGFWRGRTETMYGAPTPTQERREREHDVPHQTQI